MVFDDDERVYFVAETKGSNDLYDNSISIDERGKIMAGQGHFKEIGVPYIAPVSKLSSVIASINNG